LTLETVDFSRKKLWRTAAPWRVFGAGNPTFTMTACWRMLARRPRRRP
jgi:hypothetical protein